MNDKKQIEEMAQCIGRNRSACMDFHCKECRVDGECLYQEIAETLYREDYRKQKENNQFADIGKMYSEIKSEAIKDFAERLKTKVDIDLCEAIECSDYLHDDLPKIIDDFVKEMVGE